MYRYNGIKYRMEKIQKYVKRLKTLALWVVTLINNFNTRPLDGFGDRVHSASGFYSIDSSRVSLSFGQLFACDLII